MKIEARLSVTHSESCTVVLEKFFIFVFVTEYFSHDKPNVHIFHSTVFSSSEWESDIPHVDVFFQIDRNFADEVIDLSKTFFKDMESINLFWGNESKEIEDASNIDNLLTRYFRDIDDKEGTLDGLKSMHSTSTNVNLSPSLIYEEQQQYVEPFFLFPQHTRLADKERIRIGCSNELQQKVQQTLARYFAVGSWTRSSFSIDLRKERPFYRWDYMLQWQYGIECRDFSFYLGLPGGTHVQQQRGYVQHKATGNSAPEDDKAEVYTVISQEQNKYFDEWVRLGIRHSNLVRLEPSAQIKKTLARGTTTNIRVDIISTDEDDIHAHQRWTLIKNIWIGIVFTLGMTENFDNKIIPFPFSDKLGTSAMWLLINICFIPTFFYDRRTKSSIFLKMLRFAGWGGFMLWSVAYLVLPSQDGIIINQKFTDLVYEYAQTSFFLLCCYGVTIATIQHLGTLRSWLGFARAWCSKILRS